ncbi:hypothetical protein [Anabaena sp. AL09]|uniref:hypothetical protein n=1 Tax=Anabaena sp. AL09 TaxID=1710891 RepID=UPI00260ACF3C|nr:hypothetical protein [Anabaena sp. AL09]
MNTIIDGAFKAFELLTSANSDVFQVMTMTLFISGIATAISVLLRLPLGMWRFKKR